MNVFSADAADDDLGVLADPTFRLRLFGPLRVLVDGRPLRPMRSRKESWLLALLILHADAPIERSWLADTLWPDATNQSALYNLRRSLHELREALGPESPRLLAPTPRTLRLDLPGTICGMDRADCDLTAFDTAVRQGGEASLMEAVALYTGPFLLGCLEEWALPEREARERAALAALESLAGMAWERDDLADASAHLSRALEIDPLRETALRGLLEALAAQKSHAAAAEAYHAFRLRLRDELNAEPAPETVALYRSLRSQGRHDSVPQESASHEVAVPSGHPASTTSNLPIPLTALIGRVSETEAVAAALDRARLLTLTGTGGIGKTRLALAVAAKLRAEFADGTWFADLAPLADPRLMPQTVLTALGAQENPLRSPSDALAEYLRPRRLLLVLDNCEHLVSPCAQLTRTLLERCPELHILATSRETLGVPGEIAWRVPPLSLSCGPGDMPAQSEAVRLFVERAHGARPGWEPSEAEYAVIAEICGRLDGIPLAIEMAASRARALSVTQIATRLSDRFRLLSGQSGGVVARHQTLHATLDWSWELLTEAERILLARLSVFAGGWTLEAAEAVCGGNGIETWAVLDGLTSLIDKSLVVYEERVNDLGRYRLLETVRQYAGEKLHGRSETEQAFRSLYEHLLSWAEAVEIRLNATDQADWLDRLELEHENLRSALVWCRAQAETTLEAETMLLRLAGSLTHFWWVRGYQQEGRYFLEAALKRRSPGVPAAVWLKALQGAATLVQSQGAYDDAQGLYEEALSVARALNDRAGIAAALGGLAETLGNLGQHAAAHSLLEEALSLNRERGDFRQVAANLGFLGYIARLIGDISGARAFLSEAVTISRGLGDLLGVASNLGSLANLVCDEGNPDQAHRLFEETLALYRSLGNRGGISWTLSSLAHLASRANNLPTARVLLEEALTINRQMANRAGEAWNLRSLGEVLARLGEHSEAEQSLRHALMVSEEISDKAGVAWCWHGLGAAARAHDNLAAALGFEKKALREMLRLNMKTGVIEVAESLAALLSLNGHWGASVCLLGALDAERQSLGMPPPSEKQTDEIIHALRDHLGDAGFDVAWAAGRVMTVEEAVEYVLTEE